MEALPLVDHEGRAMPGAFGRGSATHGVKADASGRGRTEKTQNFDAGERKRYFRDDDRMDLDVRPYPNPNPTSTLPLAVAAVVIGLGVGSCGGATSCARALPLRPTAFGFVLCPLQPLTWGPSLIIGNPNPNPNPTSRRCTARRSTAAWTTWTTIWRATSCARNGTSPPLDVCVRPVACERTVCSCATALHTSGPVAYDAGEQCSPVHSVAYDSAVCSCATPLHAE